MCAVTEGTVKHPLTKEYRAVKRLYLSAFPPEERRPLWHLWLLSRMREEVSLTAYYDDGDFCGFTLTVCSGKYLYISFIAVDPALRSKGCGAKILASLQAQHPYQALLVEVEAPEEGAENALQRQRRIEFYLRNGFVDLSRSITGRGVIYRLLSTDPAYDRKAYQAIFPHLSFGIKGMLKKILHR